MINTETGYAVFDSWEEKTPSDTSSGKTAQGPDFKARFPFMDLQFARASSGGPWERHAEVYLAGGNHVA